MTINVHVAYIKLYDDTGKYNHFVVTDYSKTYYVKFACDALF